MTWTISERRGVKNPKSKSEEYISELKCSSESYVRYSTGALMDVWSTELALLYKPSLRTNPLRTSSVYDDDTKKRSLETASSSNSHIPEV